MIVRPAETRDLPELMRFYDRMCEVLGQREFLPDGNKGGFPPEKMVREATDGGFQFVAVEDGKIVAAYILNHDRDPAYRTVSWNVPAGDDETVVLHALRVLPEYGGRGISGTLLRHAIETAGAWRQKAIRLDVLEGNRIPEEMYLRRGFLYIATVMITYPDIGAPMPFKLMEYPLR